MKLKALAAKQRQEIDGDRRTYQRINQRESKLRYANNISPFSSLVCLNVGRAVLKHFAEKN